MTSIAAVRRRSSLGRLARRPAAGRTRRPPGATSTSCSSAAVVAIAAIGVLMVYSATRGPGGGEPFDHDAS